MYLHYCICLSLQCTKALLIRYKVVGLGAKMQICRKNETFLDKKRLKMKMDIGEQKHENYFLSEVSN